MNGSVCPSHLFVPADKAGRVHRMVSVRLGFPTIIWKGNHSFDFKFGVCIWWVSVQNWFTFGPRWPTSGQKMTENASKCWFPSIIWKSICTIEFKLMMYTCWVSVHNWFTFGPRWPNFGPLVATKWLKRLVSERSRRHRAAHVELQIVPLFSQSLTIMGVHRVLNNTRHRYEKCIVLGQ